jgi:hypothetical protein
MYSDQNEQRFVIIVLTPLPRYERTARVNEYRKKKNPKDATRCEPVPGSTERTDYKRGFIGERFSSDPNVTRRRSCSVRTRVNVNRHEVTTQTNARNT